MTINLNVLLKGISIPLRGDGKSTDNMPYINIYFISIPLRGDGKYCIATFCSRLQLISIPLRGDGKGATLDAN